MNTNHKRILNFLSSATVSKNVVTVKEISSATFIEYRNVRRYLHELAEEEKIKLVKYGNRLEVILR